MLMAALAEYSIMYSFEFVAPDLETKLFFSKIEYIGIVSFPVLWLSFAQNYIRTENKNLIPKKIVGILWIIPAVTLILAWTNNSHDAVWSNAALKKTGSLQILTWNHGFWFWIYISYAYLLILTGAGLLLNKIRKSKSKMNTQVALVLLGLSVPLVFNLMYIFGYSIGPIEDPTPLAFSASGIIFAVNMRLHDFFHVIPIAQHTIIENLDDGIIVLDKKDQIIDVNPAARTFISQNAENFSGKNLSSINVFQDDKYKLLLEKDEGKTEVQILRNEHLHFFIIQFKHLYDQRKRKVGRLIVIKDITSKKKNEQNELLMHELNHRTKNNLMMISSLIQIKSNSLGDGCNLSDLIHQIDTIRLVYEKLSYSGDTSRVNLKNYIQSILLTVFGATGNRISIEIMIEDISLNIRTALPIGLIINEIATNTVKYGIIPQKVLTFNITLSKDLSSNQYLMSISNSGNPFPEYIDFDKTSTMGLRLMSSLAKQINGTIGLMRHPHPEYILKFPINIAI